METVVNEVLQRNAYNHLFFCQGSRKQLWAVLPRGRILCYSSAKINMLWHMRYYKEASTTRVFWQNLERNCEPCSMKSKYCGHSGEWNDFEFKFVSFEYTLQGDTCTQRYLTILFLESSPLAYNRVVKTDRLPDFVQIWILYKVHLK